jgi:hypothetical protein
VCKHPQEQFGVRNIEVSFDAISLGLEADSDTAARLGFNTNGHDGDGWPRSSGQSSCSIEAK